LSLKEREDAMLQLSGNQLGRDWAKAVPNL
jgi:hypothetical protein